MERKARHTMVIVIELMLYSDFQLANGRTVVESRYHNFGLDSEIQSVYLKIPVKAINFHAI